MVRATHIKLCALIVAAAGVTAAVAPAMAAPTKTVTYNNIKSPSGGIHCEVQVHSNGIHCSGTALSSDGDKYVGLGDRGKPRVSYATDYDGYSTPHHKLAYGTTWKRGSVTCKMAKTGLRCTNADAHGFRLRSGSLKLF